MLFQNHCQILLPSLLCDLILFSSNCSLSWLFAVILKVFLEKKKNRNASCICCWLNLEPKFVSISLFQLIKFLFFFKYIFYYAEYMMVRKFLKPVIQDGDFY